MTDVAIDRPLLLKKHIFILVLMRVAIGWHLLYEGISKMLIPDWTSAPYLENARWLLADQFRAIAANAEMLQIVDLLNMWGLTLIGLGLILGCFTRLSALAGVLLIGLYYVANPPFVGLDFGVPAEGHYIIINKNLIEILALLAIAVIPTGRYLGLDGIIHAWLKQKKAAKNDGAAPVALGRRVILQHLATVPVLGAFAYAALKKYQWEKINAITGATIQVGRVQLKDLKGKLPHGTIAGKSISRIILGGNLIGGWAHSRDLIYVPSLFKAYNSEKKVFETLQVAEAAGINTINITHSQFPIIAKYKRIFGSSLQTVCQIHPVVDDIKGHVDKVIDFGVDFIQIQGNCCDWRVRDGEMDVLAKCIDYIREQGYPAGLGAHSIQALMACDEAGIDPDFYMKTLHQDNYWSAHPKENRIPFSVDGARSENHNEFHDNMFCLFPEKTIEFMKRKAIPYMAFKVLAGGALHPNQAFEYAFSNGADFVCVGMFDYQIVQDVNIALEALSKTQKRERPWHA